SNILFVDDSAEMIYMYKYIHHDLKKDGYQHTAFFCENIVKANTIMEEYEIDIIFCDHQFSDGHNGLFFLKSIKTKTPIKKYLVTGDADLLSMPPDINYIVKPFDLDEIKKQIISVQE
ncbi:MAG TPA: response regulator, partial [bacterium]|nr:response regulator [bacterium]